MSKLFKTTALVLAVGLFLTLVPLQTAHAAEDVWSSILGVLVGIGTTVIFFPLIIGILIFSQVAPILAYLFFFICTTLLSWTTKVTFGGIPLTHGGIIDAALPITTGFVNIGFVLVLVFIALSTILRLENYAMKKLLPKFIAIAILINFAPVICGIIIDVANVVTLGFFKNNDFGQLIGDAFKNTPLGTLFTTLSGITFSFEGIAKAANEIAGLSGIIEMVVKAAVSTFFGMFAGGVVLIYALLFVFRVIAIWLLVIMAPIAWFCWILPDTQKYYKMWESYFLQWSFIGAIMGFFLWMGARMMNVVTSFPEISITPTGAPDWIQNLFNIIPIYQILTYGSVLAFLIVGFVLSMKMSGGGTEMVTKLGMKGLNTAGGWVGGKARSFASPKIASGMEKWGGRMEGLANRDNALGKVALKPLAWAGWGMQRGATSIRNFETADLQEKKDKAGKKTIDEKDLVFKSPVAGTNDKIATFSSIIENGEIDDLTKLKIEQLQKAHPHNSAKETEEVWRKRLKDTALKDVDNMAVDLGNKAMKINLDSGKPILKSFGHQYDGITNGLSKETRERIGVTQLPEDIAKGITVIEKLASKIRAKDIPNMSESFLMHPRVIGGVNPAGGPDFEGAIHKFWTGEQVGAAGKHFSLGFLVPFQDKVNLLGKDWYKTNNKQLHKYLGNTAARSLGIGFEPAAATGGGGPTPPGGGGPGAGPGATPGGPGGPGPGGPGPGATPGGPGPGATPGGPGPGPGATPGGPGPSPSGGPTPRRPRWSYPKKPRTK